MQTLLNISSNTTSITNLNNKTTALSYDASTGFDFTGNITNGTSNITTNVLTSNDLTSSSATVGGVPVTDKFLWGVSPMSRIKTTVITGTGHRSIFAPNHLDSNYDYFGSTEGLAALESTGGGSDANCIKIPRDMTVKCSLNYTARPQQATKLYGGFYVIPYKNIDWSAVDHTVRDSFASYKIGIAGYQYLYNNSTTSTFYELIHGYKEWTLDLNQNDKLYFLVWRWQPYSDGSDDSNYSSVRMDYSSLTIEEIAPPSLSSGTVIKT